MAGQNSYTTKVMLIHLRARILGFEKSFDTPPRELLKTKLFSYGIGGKT